MGSISAWTTKIREFWNRNEKKIILVVGLILISAISFESGYLRGKTAESSPIIIEKPILGQNLGLESAQGSIPAAQNSAQEVKNGVISSNIPVVNLTGVRQDCAFVGSKNSNKYHLPTCQYAKRIKPENAVCFSSAEDAATKGYLPDKGCIK